MNTQPQGQPQAQPQAQQQQPSPLTVGTRFVKQYYAAVTERNVQRFYYQSASDVTVSVGAHGNPAVDVVSSSSSNTSDGDSAVAPFEPYAERFWESSDSSETGQLSFAFENGAIDAQVVTANGGILLVVIGEVLHTTNSGNVVSSRAFVQTFFLATAGARSYHVRNDILRFLQRTTSKGSPEQQQQQQQQRPVEEVAQVAITSVPAVELADDVQEKVPANTAPVPAPLATKDVDDAPGHGVEESKVDLLSSESDASAAATPGSWASLVARPKGGGQQPVSPPGTPSRMTVAPASSSATATSAATAATTKPTSAATEKPKKSKKSPRKPATHRDPDCTLVVKNMDAATTDAELEALFLPFATETSSSLLGVSVHHSRQIAFVDYNAAAPVLLAVARPTAFWIRNRPLEIYQKTTRLHQNQSNSGNPSGNNAWRGGGREQRGGGRGGGRGRHNANRRDNGRGGGGQRDRGGR